jgi:hypothetical protein
MPCPVTNLAARVTGRNVVLEWSAPPTGIILGYNVFRNDTRLNENPVQSTSYNDNMVATGKQTYCVLAIFSTGFSELVCTDAWIITGIPENELSVNVYPNPATDLITVETQVTFSQVSILNQLGQEVYTYFIMGKKLQIPTSGLKRGMYILKITIGNSTVLRKISVY